jgi:glucokinase
VEKIHALAQAGDASASQALEEGARALGCGVANIINIFNPDRVVLAGGVTVLGQPYLNSVREEAQKRAFHESWSHARIEMSVVGPAVGALGAAGLIRAQEKDR